MMIENFIKCPGLGNLGVGMYVGLNSTAHYPEWEIVSEMGEISRFGDKFFYLRLFCGPIGRLSPTRVTFAQTEIVTRLESCNSITRGQPYAKSCW